MMVDGDVDGSSLPDDSWADGPAAAAAASAPPRPGGRPPGGGLRGRRGLGALPLADTAPGGGPRVRGEGGGAGAAGGSSSGPGPSEVEFERLLETSMEMLQRTADWDPSREGELRGELRRRLQASLGHLVPCGA
ncbi:unnamed protein product [Prorocentrum cordatum]|uniref:Uncharacterized protein n=1 Tax=Prorocentrum cordatum TaxID=2364126 RepID=A0ABN9VTT5_9DINO|nr:unnamed protein product [Polarella glacialis]